MAAKDDPHRRATVAFGWACGASLGLILSYAVYAVSGERAPVIPTTFALVVSGCLMGMVLGDRLGVRGFRPLGIVAGILVSVILIGALLLSARTPAF